MNINRVIMKIEVPRGDLFPNVTLISLWRMFIVFVKNIFKLLGITQYIGYIITIIISIDVQFSESLLDVAGSKIENRLVIIVMFC